MARVTRHGMGGLQAVVGAVLFAFLLGLSVGILVGRRSPAARAEPAAAAPSPAPLPTTPGALKPTKRARKAGLTEADFTPSDDILERLRKAAEGELDPSEIEAPPASTTASNAEDDAEAARRADLAEKERRVLERLRQLEAEAQADETGFS